MNATNNSRTMRRWPESARWAVCFALAVAFHTAGAAALLARWNDSDLHSLTGIAGSNFEAVDVAPLMVDPNSGQAR